MQKSNKINLGINILRMWMAFEVILLHRMSWKGYDDLFFDFLKSCELFSVPVFVIIAFYFGAKTIESKDATRIGRRFVRLIIPQVGWALVCWIVYVLTDIIFMHHLDHSFSDLLIAIISGCRQNTNPSTWFQAVLILLTGFYCAAFKVLRNRHAWIFVVFSFLLALFIQFDGSYFRFFSDKPYELLNTIGRVFEIMPFAAVGLLLSHFKVYEKLMKRRYIVICLSLLMFFAGFHITFPNVEDFFGGIYPLYMALFLFLIFLFLPLEDIDDRYENVIQTASRFTLGIYCSHRLAYGILDIIYEITGITPGSFAKCLITYAVCYAVSYIVSLFPGKIFRNMVD